MFFDNARVPAENLIGGREGGGFKTAMRGINHARLHVAVTCVGQAERLVEEALFHAMNRRQFGQPLAEFQMVQGRLADMRAETLAARSMILETARAFDVLEAEFARDRTLADAYLGLARFTAGVRCGHTWPSFFNQRDAVRAALFDRPTRLPFWFDWLDGRMNVTRDFTPGAALPVGTEILRVDGVPAATLLEALLPYARADGGNDA